MNRTSTCLILVSLILSTNTRARDFTFTGGVTGQIVAQRGFDALSAQDGVALAHLEAGMELSELLPGLSLELAWETSRHRSDLFAGDAPWLETEMLIHGAVLSACFRIPLTTWLHGTVRSSAVLDFARLQFKDSDRILLSDWANARLGAIGTLGVELVFPRNLVRRWFRQPAGDDHEGFTLGLRLEAGWSVRQAFDYDQMREPRPDDEEIAKRQISLKHLDLGSIHLDGLLFRAALIVFF